LQAFIQPETGEVEVDHTGIKIIKGLKKKSIKCKRSLSFVQKCLKSENVLVNFVSRHAVFFSRMKSGVGRNVQFYCEPLGMRLHDSVPLARERKMVVDDEEMVRRASMV